MHDTGTWTQIQYCMCMYVYVSACMTCMTCLSYIVLNFLDVCIASVAQWYIWSHMGLQTGVRDLKSAKAFCWKLNMLLNSKLGRERAALGVCNPFCYQGAKNTYIHIHSHTCIYMHIHYHTYKYNKIYAWYRHIDTDTVMYLYVSVCICIYMDVSVCIETRAGLELPLRRPQVGTWSSLLVYGRGPMP